jgi:hypothetical protein
MQPIQAFSLVVEALRGKPSFFWDEKNKQKLLSQVVATVAMLKKTLEKQNLTETQAYMQLTAIQESVSQVDFKEIEFIRALSNLLDIYIVAASTSEAETIHVLQANVQKTKMVNLAYHLSLEKLTKLSKKIDTQSRENNDREMIKKGIFYVVENLLRVLSVLKYSTDEQKWKLLKEGVKTKNFGNIPPYLALEEGDRDQLCYHIYNDQLRADLLRAFYVEEEALRTNQLKSICLAIKQLTIDLLRIIQKNGVEKYHGVIYAPFGNDIPIDDLVAKIEEVTF